MIDLFKVNMPENMGTILDPILQSGYISEGPKTKEFEDKLQLWMKNPNVAVVNSGTAALTIAARLAGLDSESECIISPFTCMAQPEAIMSTGCKMVFCDVDPHTGNIDPSKIEDLITARTKAISFVNWAGTPAELGAIQLIAMRNGLKTIQDCAHSLGAKFRGEFAHNQTSYAAHSFQAIKHFTTIDGGALVCPTKEDYDRAVLLRWFGCKRGHNKSPIKWEGDVTEYGYKMHMNDVNATVGLESLKTIDQKIQAHKDNGNFLRKNLDDIPGLELLSIPQYIESSFWIFTIKLKDSEHRTKVSTALTDYGIGNGIVHTRNDQYSLFKDSKVDLPGMDDFGSRMLNVPCGWWLSPEELQYIVKVLHAVC